jgi:effector-binding domain-containing protein
VAYEIKTHRLDPQHTAAIRVTAPPSEIGETFRSVLPEVTACLDGQGAAPAGPPFARYFDYTEEEADFEAGFPVARPVSGSGRVEPGELPGGQAAVTLHRGPYEGLAEAHDEIGRWVLANDHDPAGPVWEVYLVGPLLESDPARWETEVVWPLRK